MHELDKWLFESPDCNIQYFHSFHTLLPEKQKYELVVMKYHQISN